MDKNKVGTMMQSAAKVPISELNECITCKLCKGYFIEATTIIECLHTFCRSCIVRYLESNKYCPICDVQVHKTKPLLNLRPDKTIQNLVYKLVPRLYQNEIQRRKTFYESHPEGKPTIIEQIAESQYDYVLAPEESINLTLSYHGCGAAPRYLRCPSAVLVTHLKKLIRAKYGLTEHHRVDMFFNQDCLNPSFSLMDISYIYSWKRKDPLDLTYKIYECRAKKPKLDTVDETENSVNNSANNNNNNNWKEVQLRISETGEMSITGIEDASMLELLDATENFKSEIVINEGKNLENFPKPIQVDTEIGNNEVKIPANSSVSVDNHVKVSENAPSSNKQQENAQKIVENHLAKPKKDLPGLKCIGKSFASTCTTSTVTSATSTCAGTKVANSNTKTMNNSPKTGNTPKATNSSSKTNVEVKKAPSTEAKTSSAAAIMKTSSGKSIRITSDIKLSKNSSSMPKSMELSATLNLNSELSVIPLSASTSCVSLSSCGGTTTVFSTINKSMCSTRMESGDGHGTGSHGDKNQSTMVNNKESPTEYEKQAVVNNIPKNPKNLKRKCEEDGKTPEVPTKLPKPTILNHSIGLMNLSNNHPLKKHSKMNRNGEHLLRNTEMGEKVPISSPTLTVNHVSVPQKHISMDTTLSKPIIINKNVSNLQITRPGTPKSVQRAGQGGTVPCYINKTVHNSVGCLGKMVERNGEKLEGTQGKPEVLNSAVNSISKLTHHSQLYQATQHTPIIAPSQLPQHQNLNSLQLKPSACSNSTQNPEETDHKGAQGNVAMSQTSIATSQTSTSQNNAATTQSSQKANSIATSHPNVISQNTLISQKQSDVPHESSPLINKPSVESTPPSAVTNHSVNDTNFCSTPCSVQNVPLSQTSLTTVAASVNHAPAAIKTKPSTPIGYKTLRDPPKSWNSQINSQIARVNQNAKAQQLANAAAAASQVGGVNAQGRFSGDLKSVRPAKFFKGRNMPRYLGCPASGVKPMYQVQASSEKEKSQEQLTAQIKSEKCEIKKHSIVKIDPKTLRPISEKAPEMSNLSNISSNLGVNTGQNNQDIRIISAPELKINTSSVSIFNPLKLQSSPKGERKSPKSPHSPKVKSSPTSNNLSAVTTSTSVSSPSNTLSPKQHRDKTNLTFTPPNPFVPNLTSPTSSPNQFLYPAGGFPSYDPRVMAAYHSLWYTQRMAAAAAAGFVPPPMPHAFGMNVGLNTGTTTMGQQQHNPGISPKHLTAPKTSGQPSPRGSSTTHVQISKSSSTTPNKKTKETIPKSEKSLETALNKLSQNKAKELSESKLKGNSKQQLGGSKKMGGNKELGGGSNMPVDVQRSASPRIVGGHGNPLGEVQQRMSSPKKSGGNKDLGGINFILPNSQQSRDPPITLERSNNAMSALEKLSQNKAIEIVRERDGRNSPICGSKTVLGSSRLVEVRGSSTSPVTEKTFLANDTIKRQHLSATEQKDNQNLLPEKNTDPSISSHDARSSLHTNHGMESDKTTPIPVSTSSEHKIESSETQTRLGQGPGTGSNQVDKSGEKVEQKHGPQTSEQGHNRLEHGQEISDQRQNSSDQAKNQEQDKNRLDPVQKRPDQIPCGTEMSRSALTEKKSTNTQEDPSSKRDVDSTTDSKTASSDNADKLDTNNKKKQCILDSSDIKHSSSQSCVDVSQNPSAKSLENSSSNLDTAVTDKSIGNIVNQIATSGETEVSVAVTHSNNAESEVKVFADDKSVDSENKPDNVVESDKGGGEKK